MPVELNAKNFLKVKKVAPKLLLKALSSGLEEVGDKFQARLNKNQFSGQLSGPWRRNKSKNRLANRTGNLRRSFNSRVTGGSISTLQLRATIGDAITAPYARIQEKGGTIRPKRGRMLTIPMPDNLKPSGVAKYPSAKALTDVFLIKKKGAKGGAFLVRKKPSGEGLEFLWMLKPKVTLPPRLKFVETWESGGAVRERKSILNARVAKALAKIKAAGKA